MTTAESRLGGEAEGEGEGLVETPEDPGTPAGPPPDQAPPGEPPEDEVPDEEIPLGQRIYDSPFLLLVAGIVIMLVFYTGWGLWEIATLPEASLP